jgi:predicted metalloprotease
LIVQKSSISTERLFVGRPFDLAIRSNRACYLVMEPIASAIRLRSLFATG